MNIEKRALQLAIMIGGLVPVLAGAAGVIAGVGMIPHALGEPSLDSHFRYLSGLLLAIGLGFWSAVPGIESKTGRVRLLSAIVVLGGLARAYGLVAGETSPGLAMHLALVMELGVTPLICLWQGRVAAGRVRRRRVRLAVAPATPGRSGMLPADPPPGR